MLFEKVGMKAEEGDASGGGKLNMQDPIRLEAGGGAGGGRSRARWGESLLGGMLSTGERDTKGAPVHPFAVSRRRQVGGGLLEQVREYHVSSTIYLQSIYNLSHNISYNLSHRLKEIGRRGRLSKI